jgi:hypothetical protein
MVRTERDGMNVGTRLIASTLFGMLIFFLANPLNACDQSKSANITDANVQAKLKLEKNNAENLALLVIAKFGPTTSQFVRAKELYTDAESQNNAFTSTILDNYVAGKKVDLSSTAKAAADSSKEFCDYVQSLNLESRGIELVLEAAPVLIDIGEKLWTFFADRSTEERTAFANTLRPQITWMNWNRLTSYRG